MHRHYFLLSLLFDVYMRNLNPNVQHFPQKINTTLNYTVVKEAFLHNVFLSSSFNDINCTGIYDYYTRKLKIIL